MVESLLTGKLVENYRVISVLGRGGMGTVFKAFDEELKRDVVLKMMNPRFSEDETFVRQFRKEGISQARLKHPNIVDVHALRETKLGLFIVMEFIEGITLAERIHLQGAISWQKALPIFISILKGIEHAHSKGVIHRDIKPGNIMLGNSGVVKVSDFGIAAISHDPRITSTALTGGTLAYASPEQVKSLKLADERSDIYSLGMTFYEVLAGKLPFKENQPPQEIRNRIAEGKLPSPRRLNSQIPADLAKIIMKAIHKTPEKRYQSVREMRAALTALQQLYFLTNTDNTVISSSSPPPEKVFKRPFNKRIAVAVCLIVFFIAGFFMDFHKSISNWIASPGSSSASLSIESDPENAFIYIDDEIIGITPIWDRPFSAVNPMNLRIEKDNYIPLDTTIILSASENSSFSFRLKMAYRVTKKLPVKTKSLAKRKTAPVARLGNLNIQSNPPGAGIWINDRKASGKTTPVNIHNLKIGKHSVTLRKKGYREYSTKITIKDGATTDIQAQLTALMGKLSILVLPYGSVFIDGKLKKENTHLGYNTALPAGEYTIRVTHPMFGRWEKRVEITPDGHRELSVDFNRVFDVRITAFNKSNKPVMGEIYIDDQPTGYSPPKKMPLRFGQHKIEVRRDGYQLTGGAKRITLENELDKPLRFVLEKNL